MKRLLNSTDEMIDKEEREREYWLGAVMSTASGSEAETMRSCHHTSSL